MSAHWTEKYIGLPYRDLGRDRQGADCWGLAIIVYGGELGIALPSYVGGYQSTDERREIADLIAGAQATGPWSRIEAVARPFDIALFRRGPFDSHIGIVVSPGLMIHLPDDSAKIEHYNTGRWRPRLRAIYRHSELLSKVRS